MLILSLIGVFSGFIGWGDASQKRRSAAREGVVLGLPEWQNFHALWRPSLRSLRDRAQPTHYWLRSLWGDPLVNRSLVVGVLAFVAFAIAFPWKAGSYGEGIALACLVITVIGFSRTQKAKPRTTQTILGEQAVPWRYANGFWIGAAEAAIIWDIVMSDILHYPAGNNTVFFALCALGLHAWEWFNFDQQRILALRVERAEQSRQLAEARLQMLKNQIEPHFIFNTLAHLKALIQSDPVTAQSMADELSDFLRASLTSLRQDTMTVAQDFELVRAYLALASLRMGARLSFDLNLEPGTANLPVPPLMLQTLVENAIQHGVEPKLGSGHIRVSARLDSTADVSCLVLEVADDGVGFGQANTGGSGLGLVNIRERLASAFGDHAHLKLRANAPQGVIATITLPLQENP